MNGEYTKNLPATNYFLQTTSYELSTDFFHYQRGVCASETK